MQSLTLNLLVISLLLLLLPIKNDLILNPNPLSKFNVYSSTGVLLDNQHLDFSKGEWYSIPPNTFGEHDPMFEFHPNDAVYITSSTRYMVNNQAYMEKQKKVLRFYFSKDIPPMFMTSIFSGFEKPEPNFERVMRFVNKSFNNSPEILKNWNQIGLTKIPVSNYAKAAELLNFPSKLKDFLGKDGSEAFNEALKIDIEGIERNFYYDIFSHTINLVFKNIFRKINFDDVSQEVKALNRLIINERNTFTHEFADSLQNQPGESEELSNLFSELRKLVHFFIHKGLRVFCFESNLFLNELFGSAKKPKEDDEESYNLDLLFSKNLDPTDFSEILMKQLPSFLRTMVFDEMDEEFKKYFQQEQERIKAETPFAIEKDLPLIEDPQPSDYLDSVKRALFTTFADIGGIIVPKIIEFFKAQDFDVIQDFSNLFYDGGLDFIYKIIDYPMINNEFYRAVVKYFFVIKNAFYKMPAIANQRISPEDLQSNGFDAIFQLRTIFLENGDIVKFKKIDKSALLFETADIFIEKNRLLI